VPAARLRNRTSRSDRLSEEGVPAHLGPARTKIKASTVWFESLANDAIRTKVRETRVISFGCLISICGWRWNCQSPSCYDSERVALVSVFDVQRPVFRVYTLLPLFIRTYVGNIGCLIVVRCVDKK
jgi:hypothetical protein